MSEQETKITFPFEPSEKVKAAFRQVAQHDRAVQLMTEALAHAAADMIYPWDIVWQEYPELIKNGKSLSYNHLTQYIDLKEKRT